MTTPTTFDVKTVRDEVFASLRLNQTESGAFYGTWAGNGPAWEKRSPIDGSLLGTVRQPSEGDYQAAVQAASRAFAAWRLLPAPKRGDVVRRIGDRLRAVKESLGKLVTLEAGKIVAEGEGEVQEMIDICDFANGLSRQLYGLTIASERPQHRMFEQWHPLGVVGVISAFNFPVAVWSWNAMIAAVTGNTVLWKPSEKTPFTAIACTKIAAEVCAQAGVDPAIFSLVCGDRPVGEWLAADRRIPLVSATGSTRMGRQVAQTVAARLGKSLLELGGNNAIIVTPSADLRLVQRAVLFGAVGTAGQRCTTTRRLIVHRSMLDEVIQTLSSAYQQVRIGNPLDPGTLMGPLIDQAAVDAMDATLERVKTAGGTIASGGSRLPVTDFPGGLYVKPAIVQAEPHWQVVQEETFAPILYVLAYENLPDAIAIQNSVPQGLASAIFSNDLRETELFLSSIGSDCGIANVNIGTSGAEIGGAFGGEKDTGGGRESGSDSWKAYMRRQTVTINYSPDLPLAQGIRFE